MTPFTTLTSIALPMPDANIDTDIILPARFLLITEKAGLGRHAFFERRFHADGTPRADFPLNDARYRSAQILVAGDNFGCGSSREQAPWALADLGLRCIIAPGFGEIFAGNCARNGILAVALPPGRVDRLMADARARRPIEVDLITLRIKGGDGDAFGFEIAAGRRDALINGWDEIATIMARHAPAIGVFEGKQRDTQPWLWKDEPHG